MGERSSERREMEKVTAEMGRRREMERKTGSRRVRWLETIRVPLLGFSGSGFPLRVMFMPRRGNM